MYYWFLWLILILRALHVITDGTFFMGILLVLVISLMVALSANTMIIDDTETEETEEDINNE